ncbi:mediator complex subunit Med5-domain-containing protein [Glomus cerebriforme]|uniref:Mediator of RNA polymerase II transcription subunit 5 n=1 Tax=Glomus cerebriforme TaxID=658196 RepID=A0A397SZP2_9GLOM|nr:mediator complex subunit Med5-domain-containing protein [Glomus cerebriforme]
MKYNQSNGVINSPAIPSISIMFFVYNLVQTRPVMPDDMAVEYLERLQHIQDSYDHEFYVELWMSALTGLAEECDKTATGEAGGIYALLWKSFVLVKLPSLIEKLELKKSNKNNNLLNFEENKYNCHECVINQLFGFKGLINACNQFVEDDIFQAADITIDILRVCLNRKLVRKEFVNRLLELEYEIDGGDTVGLTAGNILDDPSRQIIDHLVSTATTSFLHQESRVETIFKLMSEWSIKSEVAPLATLCRSLMTIPTLLDIIHLYRHPSEFLSPLERLCNTWTSKTETRESLIQDYENFGTIFLFLISIIDRYEFHKNLKDVLHDEEGFCYKWIRSGSAYDIDSLDPDKSVIARWVSALSDSSQEIPEDLIQVNPRILIELSPTIFKEALKKVATDNIVEVAITSLEPLFTHFLKPHMSYALIGVCQSICDDILFKGKSSLSYKVLNRLILEKTFPNSIIKLIGNKLLSVLNIISENGGSLPSVEDTEISMRYKVLEVATSMLVPDWTNHPAEKLYYRFKIMFKSIIYGGRQKPSLIYEIFLSENYFNNDINTEYEYITNNSGGVTNNLFDEFSWLGPHHLDIELFRNCLEINGPRIFVDLIIEEVLSAGKKGMGIRAAELGASLLTLPIYYTWNEYLHPATLIKIFFVDFLPLILEKKIEMYTQSYSLGIMTLFILMMIRKDTQSVGGVGVSIDEIVDISNSVGGTDDDIIMIDAIMNTTTEEKAGNAEGKSGAKVEDFIKFVLPIFKRESDNIDSKVVQNGTKKIDSKVKSENEPKLINGPAKGFIDGLLIHEDMKMIIPELESLVKK